MQIVERDQEYEDQQVIHPQTPTMMSNVLPNSDPDFMRWLFDLRERVVTPLKYAWMGYELNLEGKWKKKEDSTPIMNQKGINWSTEIIESYINPAYIISNYDEKWFNYTMGLASSVIINNLTSRHKEFDLNKLDIENVALQIESKIQAILLGARGDGYRSFFGKTRQEHVVSQRTEATQSQRGGGMLGIFNKKQANQMNQGQGF